MAEPKFDGSSKELSNNLKKKDYIRILGNPGMINLWRHKDLIVTDINDSEIYFWHLRDHRQV
jgi:hypothetical protein